MRHPSERRCGQLLGELQRATPKDRNPAGANQHMRKPATVADNQPERTPYRETIERVGIPARC